MSDTFTPFIPSQTPQNPIWLP